MYVYRAGSSASVSFYINDLIPWLAELCQLTARLPSDSGTMTRGAVLQSAGGRVRSHNTMYECKVREPQHLTYAAWRGVTIYDCRVVSHSK